MVTVWESLVRWVASLPAPVRHTILLVIGTIVGCLMSGTYAPGAIWCAVATAVVGYLTPLVQTWGFGTRPEASGLYPGSAADDN